MTDRDESDARDASGTPEKEDEAPSTGDIRQDLRNFFQDKFGAEVFSIPLGASAPGPAEPDPPEEDSSKTIDSLQFDLTPQEVKRHLDRYVIGQEEAKKTLSVAVCDHYNHVRSVHAQSDSSVTADYVKQNVILLGPTGVGKTYVIRTLAQLIGVPFVKADITKFSETGYVGGDVDDLVRELVRVADGNVELAEFGVVFLDEIDKIAGANNMIGRDVSGRGVQTGLLKLLEETEVPVRSPTDIGAQVQDMLQMRRGKTGKRTINTRHILFVASGAFTGLSEIVEKRLSERNIGFGATGGDLTAEETEHVLSLATAKDFVDYGFEPEFVGRLPVRVALRDLGEDDMYRILTTSEGSILRQYVENFKGYGIDITFEDDALHAIAARSMEERTGARGLMTVLESCLRDFKFHLPGTEVKRFVVDATTVRDREESLQRVLADPAGAARRFTACTVRKFEDEFEARHGVRLVLDDASIDMADAVAEQVHLSVTEYLDSVFKDHVEFLRKVSKQTGRREFPVTPQVLHRPGDGVTAWLQQASPASGP